MRLKATYEQRRAFQQAMSSMLKSIPEGGFSAESNYVVCPWHNWKFNRVTGIGEAGSEDDAVPSYKVKVKSGRVLVRMTPATPRKKKPHAPHPLARPIRRKCA
jgi:hypothetical protein